jgi:hypothetical protein
MDATPFADGRRAVDRGDKLDQLADRVARLASADDVNALHTDEVGGPASVSRETPGPTAAAKNTGTRGEAPASSRHAPRLAELIKLKRAEIERLGSTPVGWLDSIGQAPPLRPLSSDADRTHAADMTGPTMGAPPPFQTPGMATAHAHAAAASHSMGTYHAVPPSPPPVDESNSDSAAYSSRLSDMRAEGFSNGLYGFGVGLSIALISGAALYVVLRLM